MGHEDEEEDDDNNNTNNNDDDHNSGEHILQQHTITRDKESSMDELKEKLEKAKEDKEEVKICLMKSESVIEASQLQMREARIP